MWANSLLSLLPLVVLAFAQDCEHKVKEQLVAPPRGWTLHGPAPLDHLVKLCIALPQSNFAAMEDHLYQISNPSHERYGQHLSNKQIEGLVAPRPESIDAVNEWLASHGIGGGDVGRSPAGDGLTIKIPVLLAEKMLDTSSRPSKYHVWKHTGGEYLVRTTSYSLPKTVFDHVELIQPTTIFGTFRKLKSTIHSISKTPAEDASQNAAPVVLATGVTVDPSCNSTITITCLKQLYNAVDFTPSALNPNTIAVTGYMEQFTNRADLQQFYEDQVPAAAAVHSTYRFISVNGGLNLQNGSLAGVEVNLDTHAPFIPDIGTPTNTNEPYTEWLDFVLSQNTPSVISTSYGKWRDDEQTVPLNFAQRVCQGFAQLGTVLFNQHNAYAIHDHYGAGARGVSLMFSSGDGGVGDGDPDPATQECITNDGTNSTRFIPGFPASCPFVTAVGGTVFIPEVAVPFSGGGFSNYFSRPSYQYAAVEGFLKGLPQGTYAGLFNPNGRGIPDVATQSDFFKVFIDGKAFLIGGTSASSSTFAGFVALLNNGRFRNGLSPLGFLNPLLYSKAVSGFNDITVGNNPGEFAQATKGWDAVTGLGTPDFAKLLALVTYY
ncbi:subtilisin-like protein [Mycena maculata]|uniref:Subtilisin-like protein n=1 Tax=Mycena maculata TaxID=230809 RepID=A0AAD7I357_9AGAR|nr:subtilisin-like protein [Mycena maculata]